MSENNISSVVNQQTLITYASEWKASGYSGKPRFTFETIGMLEGCKLYVEGIAEAVGEVAERPQFVKLSKLNKVYLYKFNEEFKDLETAEKALKSVGIGTRDGKPAKPQKVSGWKYFKVKFVTSDGEERLYTIKYIWDKWEFLSSAKDVAASLDKIAIADAKTAKEAKPSASAKKSLAARIAELEAENAALRAKQPTRIIKKES
jgi:hypothetical protein